MKSMRTRKEKVLKLLEELEILCEIHEHPPVATVVISYHSFLKFLDWSGNSYEFINLYEK